MSRKLKTVPTSLLLTGAFWPVVEHTADDEYNEPDSGGNGDQAAEAGRKSAHVTGSPHPDTEAD